MKFTFFKYLHFDDFGGDTLLDVIRQEVVAAIPGGVNLNPNDINFAFVLKGKKYDGVPKLAFKYEN